MANVCLNVLIIKGETETLRQFDKQFKSEYQHIVGRTTYTHKNNDTKPDKDVLAVNERHKKLKGGITAITRNIVEQIETVVGEYSFNNFKQMTKDDFLSVLGWSEWSLRNWGTQRDLEMLNAPTTIDDNMTEIRYYFNTDWEPSIIMTYEMHNQYPTLAFEHRYEESGNQIAGVVILNDEINNHTSNFDCDMSYVQFLHEYLKENVYHCQKCNTYYFVYEVEDLNNICECKKENLIYLKGVD